jgi:hypothetical protein
MCRKESQPLGSCDTLLAEAKDGRRTTIVCLRSSRYALFAFYQMNYFSLMPGTEACFQGCRTLVPSQLCSTIKALEHHPDAHDHASMNMCLRVSMVRVYLVPFTLVNVIVPGSYLRYLDPSIIVLTNSLLKRCEDRDTLP